MSSLCKAFCFMFLLSSRVFDLYFCSTFLKQVYSRLQGKRDVETILTMGIMEDVTIIPQPAAGASHIFVIFLFIWYLYAHFSLINFELFSIQFIPGEMGF